MGTGRNGKLGFLERNPLGIRFYYDLSQTSLLDQLPPWAGNIPTICKNMTTTKKIVWSYLDYVSTPNVHAACFIFTSVTLHINVWYRKIWWANYASLPTFTLHTRFWTQFLKLYLLTPTEGKFLNWENANSIVTSVEFRKKEECAFLKHSHTNGNCKTDFLAQLKAPSQHWTLVTCWVQKEQTGLAVLVVARKALEDKVQWRFENSSRWEFRLTENSDSEFAPYIPENAQQPCLFF